MLNSGAPGVMLDLEDSQANYWPNLMRGIENVLGALRGYFANRFQLISPTSRDYKVAWVMDFPSFMWDEDEKRWVRLRVTNAALRIIDRDGIEAVLAERVGKGAAKGAL